MAKKGRLRPLDIRVVMLKWLGYTNVEIAKQVECNPLTITKILAREGTVEYLEELKSGSFSTMLDIQSMAQAASPQIMEEQIRMALKGEHESTRLRAGKAILEIAGHKPLTRVQVEHPDRVLESYEDKSEAEIRAEILKSLENLEKEKDPFVEEKEVTIH